MRWCHLFPVLALAASAATAQSPAEKNTARALATEANDKFEAGDYPGALAGFVRANQIVPTPPLALYVARCQEKLGKLIEAQESYRRLVTGELPPNSPAAFRQAIKEAEAELDALAARVPQIQVIILTSNQSPARLEVDGADRTADIGTWIPLNPGAHKLHVQAHDYESFDQTLDIKVGDRNPLKIELKKQAPPPVFASASAPASAATPPPPPPAPSRPPAGGNGLRTAGYWGVGLGAAGLAVGAFLGFMTLSKKSDFSSMCDAKSCSPDAQSDYNTTKSYAEWSTIGVLAGGALLATGVILLASSPAAPRTEAAHVSPRPVRVGLGLGSVSVDGTF